MEIDVNQFLNGAIIKAISLILVPTTELESHTMGVADVFTSMVNGTINGVEHYGLHFGSWWFDRRCERIRRIREWLGARSRRTKGREFALVISSWPRSCFGGTCGPRRKRLLRSIRDSMDCLSSWHWL